MTTEKLSPACVFILITFLFCLSDIGHATVNKEVGDDLAVTLNVNKTFTSFNHSHVTGTGSSDGRKAVSYVSAGPYEEGRSRAQAGVLFDVHDSPLGTPSFLDAVISVTFSYKLKVDFDVLPPSQRGGGSADARLYAWIRNDTDGIIHEKKELENIVFIHDKNFEEKTGKHTFSHRLTNAPSWTHLHVGKRYEVSIELYTHADVYIGNEALAYAEVTIEEIRVEFDTPVSIQPDDFVKELMTHWSFDEGHGNIVRDRSGNSNDGVTHGGAFVSSNNGYSFRFDGVNDYITIATTPSLDIYSKELSIIAYAKVPSTYGWILFRDYTKPGGYGLHVGLAQANGGVTLHLYTGDSNNRIFGHRNIQDNQWHLIVATYSSGIARIYIDGVLDAEQAVSPVFGPNAGQYYLGRCPWSEYLKGDIDEIQVYNFALTQSEVRALWTGSTQGFEEQKFSLLPIFLLLKK